MKSILMLTLFVALLSSVSAVQAAPPDSPAGKTPGANESTAKLSQPKMIDDLLEGRIHEASKTDPAKGNGAAAKQQATASFKLEFEDDRGPRTTESVERVVRAYLGGFRISYQRRLRNNPELHGDLAVRFTIAPQGDIVDIAATSSTTGNAELDHEIVDRAHRMRFDQVQAGKVVAVLHLNFRSE